MSVSLDTSGARAHNDGMAITPNEGGREMGITVEITNDENDARLFTMTVMVDGEVVNVGRATSLASAEQFSQRMVAYIEKHGAGEIRTAVAA